MSVTQYEDPQYLEAVYAALFALLSETQLPNSMVWNSKTRVVQVPDQIPPASQPSLLMVEGAIEAQEKQVFGPVKWIIHALALIYFRSDGTVSSPNPLAATVANRIIWALSRQIEATQPPYQKQTLDGLVYHCWVDGGIYADLVEQQVIIVAPITILPGPVG